MIALYMLSVAHIHTHTLQKKRFDLADLTAQSMLTKLALGQCLEIWISGGLLPSVTVKTEPKLFIETIQLRLNICFPARSMKLWQVPGRQYYMISFLIKTLGTKTLTRIPGWQHFLHVVTSSSWGIKYTLCASTERGLWKPTPVSPRLCPTYLFPLLILFNILSL